MDFNLPKINWPSIKPPSTDATNTAMIMEFLAPGTGIGSGIVAQQKPSFFDNIGKSLSGLFGGSKAPNSPAPMPGQEPVKDYTVYYVIGAVVLIVAILLYAKYRKK